MRQNPNHISKHTWGRDPVRLGERIREGPLSGASCTVASKLRRHVPMPEQRSPLLILGKVLCSRSPFFVVFRVCQLSKKMSL